MFGFGKPKCPVDLLTAEWQEARFEWLGRVLGGDDPAQPVVVEPTSSFFPWRLDSEEGARRAFEAVCTHMGVDPESVVLEFQDGTKQARENFSKLGQWESDAPGGTWDDQGPHRIVISRDAFGDAMYFVYVAAHELGHQVLLGGALLTGDEEDNEPLTDLLTVYKGLGIFGANACVHFSQFQAAGASGHEWATRGYLGMADWSYTLALFAKQRGETRPPWRKHLRPDVRALFDKAQNWINRRPAQ